MKILIKIKNKIKSIKKEIERRQIIRSYLKEIKKAQGDKAIDKIALASCQWVDLYWAEQKRPFLIHKVTFQELLFCGSFPNVLYKFVKGFTEALDLKDVSIPEANLKKQKEEEEEFCYMLAERSMIYPRYRDCYEAITSLMKNDEAAREDVIPRDFINDLFLWYLTEWENELKKKLEQQTLNELGESQNTGEKHPATTSKA